MAENNPKLITFLKKNKGRTVSEAEAVQATGIDPGKIGPALWAAEPVADPSLKFAANKGNIVKARKNGIRWERIAHRTGKPVAEVKDIGGNEAANVYTGRGRRSGANGDGPAKAASGRRAANKGKTNAATSGRRAASGSKGKAGGARARTRAEKLAKAGNPS
jgi:hypothetical protein